MVLSVNLQIVSFYILCVRKIKCYCPKSLTRFPFITDDRPGASRITGVLTEVTGSQKTVPLLPEHPGLSSMLLNAN